MYTYATQTSICGCINSIYRQVSLPLARWTLNDKFLHFVSVESVACGYFVGLRYGWHRHRRVHVNDNYYEQAALFQPNVLLNCHFHITVLLIAAIEMADVAESIVGEASPTVGTDHEVSAATPWNSASQQGKEVQWRVRQMTKADIDACAYYVQRECYPPDLQESNVPYAHRFNGFQAGCFVAETLGPVTEADPTPVPRVVGYIQSHPWTGPKPPCVSVPEDQLLPIPSTGEYYFLFDCATVVKGCGIGEALMDACLGHAAACRNAGDSSAPAYSEVRLVAVRGAWNYWSRLGFLEFDRIPAGEGYGDGEAVCMKRALVWKA